MAGLYGEHDYSVDPKGRISLPTDWRELLRDGVMFTLGQDRCIYVYPLADWDQAAAKMEDLDVALRENRDYRRMVFGNAQPSGLDEQGRLVIPRKLRDKVALGKQAKAIGNRSHVELWATEVWERHAPAVEERYSSGALIPEGLRGGGA